MGKLNRLLLLPLALLLMVPLASAASAKNGGYITAAYDNVKCLTDFEDSVIGSITGAVPQASGLSASADKLTSDTSTLQGYAAGGDAEGFRSFLRGTYEPDVTAANQAIRDARKSYRDWNVSASTRASLKASFNESQATLSSCRAASLGEAGQARVKGYQDTLAEYGAKADNLSAKGIDASGMRDAISSAQSTIVAPLQAALASATTPQEMRAALGGYCLANGCANGTNDHFYAKFDGAKLQAILDYVKPNATAAGLGAQVSQAQSDIDAAQAALNSVGTFKYDPSNEKAVWDGLKDAATQMKSILKGMRAPAGGNRTGSK